MVNLDLLLGLFAITLAIFFGLGGLRTRITRDLSTIKETIIAIQVTVEKPGNLSYRGLVLEL